MAAVLLENITATARPSGNTILLSWENRTPDIYPAVRVVRSKDTHPLEPDDGQLVAETQALLFTAESGVVPGLDSGMLSPDLRNKFVASGHPLTYDARIAVEIPGARWIIIDADTRYIIANAEDAVRAYRGGVETVSDAPLQSETVYYYTLFPFKGEGASTEFAIDQRSRVAAIATGPYDMAGQMYDLLPAIYHRYDTVLPNGQEVAQEDRERGELRRFLELPGSQFDQLYSMAKAVLDLHNLERVDGRLLPLLAQWVGWDTDYRADIAKQRNELRYAPYIYERIGIIPTIEATVKRVIGWESRTKEFIHNIFQSNNPERLNLWSRIRGLDETWSEAKEPLSLDFAYEGRLTSARDNKGTAWLFYHTLKKDRTEIWFKTYREDRESKWTPSQPVPGQKSLNKHPAALWHLDKLWLFWDVYDPEKQAWQIEYRTKTDDGWVVSEAEAPFADSTTERKTPCAAVDNAGGMWLFWLEKAGDQWKLRYNRRGGNGWGSPVAFPLDNGNDPRVEADPFVLADPSSENLWVFWARQEAAQEDSQLPDEQRPKNQTRWTIAYRKKTNVDPDDAGWDEVKVFSVMPAEYHDREPAALVNDEGKIEIFCSSNRGGTWSVWNSTIDPSTGQAAPEIEITSSPYSKRAPLPVALPDGRLMLLYRSNESVVYTSALYGATETLDSRYAGSTTVDTRDQSKRNLWEEFEDFQSYVYDAGKTESNWYARDTVGIYFSAESDDDASINQKKQQIKKVLPQFLPALVRTVFVVSGMRDVYRGVSDSYEDRAGFRWFRTWYGKEAAGSLGDPAFRLLLEGLPEGE